MAGPEPGGTSSEGPQAGLPAAGLGSGAAGAYDFPVDLADLTSAPALIAQHVPRGAFVLDIGCASGNLLLALRTDRGASGVGLEIDPDAVLVARGKGLEVHRTDLSREPLDRHVRGRRFDRVILADVLEHLVDPAAVLRQVPALVAEGGRVLVSLPNATHFDVVLALAQDRFPYTDTGLLDRTHLRFYTLATFTDLAHRCGLAVRSVQRHIAAPLATELWRGGVDLPPRYLAMLEQCVRAANPNADVYQFILELEPGPSSGAAAQGPTWGAPPALAVLERSPAVGDGTGGRDSPADDAADAEEQRIALLPGLPFGVAILRALDEVRAPVVGLWAPARRPGRAPLRTMLAALDRDPELVAVCAGSPPAGRQPVPEGGGVHRLQRGLALAGVPLPLGGLAVRTAALRLAVQSVAALGTPFLTDLDERTLITRLVQWGEVATLGARGEPTAAPLPLAAHLALVPVPAWELLADGPAPA